MEQANITIYTHLRDYTPNTLITKFSITVHAAYNTMSQTQTFNVEAFEARFKQLLNEATTLSPHEANRIAYNLVAFLHHTILTGAMTASVQPHDFTILCACSLEADTAKARYQVSFERVDRSKTVEPYATVLAGYLGSTRKEAVATFQYVVERAVRNLVKADRDHGPQV